MSLAALYGIVISHHHAYQHRRHRELPVKCHVGINASHQRTAKRRARLLVERMFWLRLVHSARQHTCHRDGTSTRHPGTTSWKSTSIALGKRLFRDMAAAVSRVSAGYATLAYYKDIAHLWKPIVHQAGLSRQQAISFDEADKVSDYSGISSVSRDLFWHVIVGDMSYMSNRRRQSSHQHVTGGVRC